METWEVQSAAKKAELLAESVVKLVKQAQPKHARRAGNELGLIVVGTQRRLVAEKQKAPRGTVEAARRLAVAWRLACVAMQDQAKIEKVDEWISRLDALLLIGPVAVQRKIEATRRRTTAITVTLTVIAAAVVLGTGAFAAFKVYQAVTTTALP
jgi:hypothetical protein